MNCYVCDLPMILQSGGYWRCSEEIVDPLSTMFDAKRSHCLATNSGAIFVYLDIFAIDKLPHKKYYDIRVATSITTRAIPTYEVYTLKFTIPEDQIILRDPNRLIQKLKTLLIFS